MDRRGYASPFSRPLLLALPPLFSFPPVSLYPVHSLSETPLNRHRNVYVKLTPQNHPNFLVPSLDGLQKFQFIFYILKMCILLGIGIRTIFQNSELLNLANFCEKSWHTPLRYMVCAAIANVSYSFQHRSFKLCRMFVHVMKMCISQNDTRQEICYVGPTGSVGYTCTIFCLISYVLYTNFCGDSLMNHGDILLDEEY